MAGFHFICDGRANEQTGLWLPSRWLPKLETNSFDVAYLRDLDDWIDNSFLIHKFALIKYIIFS